MDSKKTATSSEPAPLLGGKKPEKEPKAPKGDESVLAEKKGDKKSTKDKAPRKSKKGLFIIIAAAAVVIGGGVAALIILLNLNKDNNPDDTVYDTDAFFIRESGDSASKFALFKNDGSRLTDFNFTFGGSFINGYATVRNADDQFGIIDHTGNMSVDFGEYERIYELGGLFEVKSGDNTKIISGNGNDVVTDYVDYKRSYDSPYVAVETEKNKYSLYNAFGESLAEFESENRPTFETRDKRIATSVAYDGHLILLNNKTLKKTFDQETDIRYILSDVSVDEKVYTFVKEDYSERTMAYYADGEFHNLDKKCGTITINDDESNKNRLFLSCRNDDGTFLIRDNKITDIPVGDYSNRYVIYDANHYGRYDSKESKFQIFVDGNEKKTVNAGYTPSVTGSGYSIRDYENKLVALYDTNGDIIYKLDGITYGDLYGADENGVIMVRDPREEDSDNRNYLVDKDGNIISDKYATISRRGKYYTAYRYDTKKYYLLGADGKVIVEDDYSGIDFYKKNALVFGRKDKKYDFINIEGKSAKAVGEGALSVNENGYFAISNDDETSYYTFSGDKFYTQKK